VEHPALEKEEASAAEAELLRAQRAALLELRHDGAISADAYEQLATDLDARLDALTRQHADEPS
jgi:hypothetical protein